jgi:hypothetical protein
MLVPLTAVGDAFGVFFALLLFLLPVVYIWLRSRGVLGDASGRSLR